MAVEEVEIWPPHCAVGQIKQQQCKTMQKIFTKMKKLTTKTDYIAPPEKNQAKEEIGDQYVGSRRTLSTYEHQRRHQRSFEAIFNSNIALKTLVVIK